MGISVKRVKYQRKDLSNPTEIVSCPSLESFSSFSFAAFVVVPSIIGQFISSYLSVEAEADADADADADAEAAFAGVDKCSIKVMLAVLNTEEIPLCCSKIHSRNNKLIGKTNK